jgi:hypothetical protein
VAGGAPASQGRKTRDLVSSSPVRRRWVWIFALAAEGGQTRLISRNRIAGTGKAADSLLDHRR